MNETVEKIGELIQSSESPMGELVAYADKRLADSGVVRWQTPGEALRDAYPEAEVVPQ